MLDRMRLVNFRAFKEADFRFGKINIFVGPNNSGKSSAISAINLIAQSIKNRSFGVPLLLRGEYDDLGTYIDLVYKNVPRTKMGIDLYFGEFCHSYEFKYRTQRKEIEILKYNASKDGESLYRYEKSKDSEKRFISNIDINNIASSISGANDLSEIDDLNSSKVRVLGMRILDPFLSYRIYAAVIKSKKYDQRTKDKIISAFENFNEAKSILSRSFSEFESLGAFREAPKRTFLFSGEAPAYVGRYGQHAIDIITLDHLKRGRAGKNIVGHISDWFRKSGISQGVEVNTLTPRHFEICVLDNFGRKHNICDVGFGCSQVIPVLISGLNIFSKSIKYSPENGPMLIVQEPEIHLHPNAQAELGTFFVNLIRDVSNGQMFIETHSDTMLIRIQSHVANGDISPEDVKVFYLEQGEDGPNITPINMKEDGVFENTWPHGFFPQRQQETLALARSASKRKGAGYVR